MLTEQNVFKIYDVKKLHDAKPHCTIVFPNKNPDYQLRCVGVEDYFNGSIWFTQFVIAGDGG